FSRWRLLVWHDGPFFRSERAVAIVHGNACRGRVPRYAALEGWTLSSSPVSSPSAPSPRAARRTVFAAPPPAFGRKVPSRSFLTMGISCIIQVEPFSRDGRFSEGGHPCTALILLTTSGDGSHRSSLIVTTTAKPVIRGRTIFHWSTASSGTCTP